MTNQANESQCEPQSCGPVVWFYTSKTVKIKPIKPYKVKPRLFGIKDLH